MNYQIGNEASASHLLNGMLGRLGFLLSVNHGDVGNVDINKVSFTHSIPQLRESFDKGHTLNVADSAPLVLN